MGVRRAKAALSSRCKPHPAIAPAAPYGPHPDTANIDASVPDYASGARRSRDPPAASGYEVP